MIHFIKINLYHLVVASFGCCSDCGCWSWGWWPWLFVMDEFNAVSVVPNTNGKNWCGSFCCSDLALPTIIIYYSPMLQEDVLEREREWVCETKMRREYEADLLIYILLLLSVMVCGLFFAVAVVWVSVLNIPYN